MVSHKVDMLPSMFIIDRNHTASAGYFVSLQGEEGSGGSSAD